MQIMDTAKISSCEEKEKFVLIILDEMHIKEDLVYDKHTGIAFCNYVHVHVSCILVNYIFL